MVPYLLDFNEKLILETALTTTENYYCTSIVTFIGYSWNSQGAFLYPMFLEHYFRILPGVSLGIFRSMLGISQGNVPRIFHEHIFAWWGKNAKFAKKQ